MKKIPLATLHSEHCLTEDSDRARDLYAKSSYGSIQTKRVKLTFSEALYLHEKEKINLVNQKGQAIDEDKLIRTATRNDKAFWKKYVTFRDLRDKGYIVKTGLKFGVDFRVYKKNTEHAQWLVMCTKETERFTWQQFASSARVTNTAKKKLLIAVTDDEDTVTYYECAWTKP